MSIDQDVHYPDGAISRIQLSISKNSSNSGVWRRVAFQIYDDQAAKVQGELSAAPNKGAEFVWDNPRPNSIGAATQYDYIDIKPVATDGAAYTGVDVEVDVIICFDDIDDT